MTVIRDAVIRIRTERAGSSGGGFEARALAAEARAAGEAAKEIERTNKGLRENEVRFGRFEVQGVRALARVGRGVLDLGRGFALLATSSEEDAQKIVQNFVAIEGAISAAKGVASVYNGLNTLVGTAATGMIAYASAVTGAFVALDYFSESQRRARREIEEFNAAREGGLRLLRQEQIELQNRAAIENERASIDLQIANLGTPGERLASLAALRGRLTKDQSNAALREQFARGRLGDIDAGIVNRGHRPAAQADLVAAEERQATVLRERIRVEQDILSTKLEELREQESNLRNSSALRFFEGLPGIGGAVGGGTDASVRALQQQAKEIESASAQILRELLTELRSQAEQVSQARKDLQSLAR